MTETTLTAAQIINANDWHDAYVETPEWAPDGIDPGTCQVRVRSLTGAQRQELQRAKQLGEEGQPTAGGWIALCCAMGIIDEKASYCFPQPRAAAIELGKKHEEVLGRIANKILDLSNMTKTQRELAEKNSQATLTKSGGSDSQLGSTLDSDSTLTPSSETQTPASSNDGKPTTE